MKKVVLIFLIFLTGVVHAQDEAPLEKSSVTIEEFEAALKSFENGDAQSGLNYFRGCLAGMILVENDLLLFDDLDAQNAPVSDFNVTSDRCLERIRRTRSALEKYEDQSWPLRVRLEVKTLNWLEQVENLVKDYLIELAEPLSRSDDSWNEENHQLFERYLDAYDRYLVVDGDWVAFQQEFAEANDFEIEGVIALNYGDESLEMGLDDFKENARTLSNGEVTDAVSYFDGILGYIIQIDAHFNSFTTLDEADAALTEFNLTINLCRSLIFDLRKAMVLYQDKRWEKKTEFDKLTNKWVNIVEKTIDKYIVQLAEPMSKPDSEWTDKELKLFNDKYLVSYDKYLEIDQEWVDFQGIFAKANNFTLGPDIDADSILK